MDKDIINYEDVEILLEIILQLGDIDTAKKFFKDLLSENELKSLSNRLKVAWLLSKNIPYTMIVSETGASSTTIARVSKCLQNPEGGYNKLLGLIE